MDFQPDLLKKKLKFEEDTEDEQEEEQEEKQEEKEEEKKEVEELEDEEREVCIDLEHINALQLMLFKIQDSNACSILLAILAADQYSHALKAILCYTHQVFSNDCVSLLENVYN